jgi:hypothetical protein
MGSAGRQCRANYVALSLWILVSARGSGVESTPAVARQVCCEEVRRTLRLRGGIGEPPRAEPPNGDWQSFQKQGEGNKSGSELMICKACLAYVHGLTSECLTCIAIHVFVSFVISSGSIGRKGWWQGGARLRETRPDLWECVSAPRRSQELVHFAVRCSETAYGESVVAVGNCEPLGYMDAVKGTRYERYQAHFRLQNDAAA